MSECELRVWNLSFRAIHGDVQEHLMSAEEGVCLNRPSPVLS